MYFTEDRLAIEIDEFGHVNRDEDDEDEREEELKELLNVNSLQLILMDIIMMSMLNFLE